MRIVIISYLILYSFSLLAQPAAIFNGGHGDGVDASFLLGSEVSFFAGGNGDGYASSYSPTTSTSNYIGSAGDGYQASSSVLVDQVLALGSYGDGYGQKEYLAPYEWTGTIGSGWNVGGNWNRGVPPDLDRLAIIPNGVPNFPILNAGIFAIGSNPNNGSFVCQNLWIKQGAMVSTRINNRLQNYGLIRINGLLRVKGSTPDALFNAGQIEVNPTGNITIRP